MSFINTYKQLLNFNLYHHYFLDDGSTPFDDNNLLKADQLKKYDLFDFISISPSKRTQGLLNGQKIRQRLHSSGFSLYVKAEETAPNSGDYRPFVALEQNTTLDFLIYVKDPLFENYSTVSASPPLPFLFSNRKPLSHVGTFSYIDLESTTNSIEDFFISEDTYDELKPRFHASELVGLFGIISFEMQGDNTFPIDGNSRNVIEPNGNLLGVSRTYKIQIINRSTIWNYRNHIDGSLIHSSDPTELPLVKNGIVGYTFDSEERPSATASRILFEKDGGGMITKTISEIYIN